PAHRRRAGDLPPPLRRGRPRGPGLPQGPGRGRPGPVPGLAERAAGGQLRREGGRRYACRADRRPRRGPERAGLHGRGRARRRRPASLPAQLAGGAPGHRAARPVRVRGRAVRAPARHAGRARDDHRRWRRALPDPHRPRPARHPRTNANHPVPQPQGSKEPSLMATEARDLTQEAPERINPVPEKVDLGAYKDGRPDPVNSVFTPKRGLSHEVVEEISVMKGEPEWMRTFRHKSLDYFLRRPMPQWGGDLDQIDFDNIYYFLRATEKQAASWEELPADIKNTYDKLGIPEAEKQRLSPVAAAQYESEVVYHKVREDLEEQGVLFLDTDTALKEHEELFR